MLIPECGKTKLVFVYTRLGFENFERKYYRLAKKINADDKETHG